MNTPIERIEQAINLGTIAECRECAGKAGSPEFCRGCVHNRNIYSAEQAEASKLRVALMKSEMANLKESDALVWLVLKVKGLEDKIEELSP